MFDTKHIEDAARRTGYSPLQVESLMNLMNAARGLSTEELVLTGGTAVQQAVKAPYRRISLDLDYDLGTGMHVEAIDSLMELHGFRGGEYDRFSGTRAYYRISPEGCKFETKPLGDELNDHRVRIRINVKRITRTYVYCDFNALPGVSDTHPFRQKILGIERLLAGKIVLSAKSEKAAVGGVRHKDLFDVVALVNFPRRKLRYKVVAEEIKRDLRIRGSSRPAKEVIQSCESNLAGLLDSSAAGFYSSYKVSEYMSGNIGKLIEKARAALDKMCHGD
jgi:predicted nucleotidyltransferase component of viral defense system